MSENTPAPEDQVRLRPFLGLKPGVYLAVIYAAVLLIVLFFILLYPGLRRPGSIVALKTEPAGAALRVDGLYMGTAPDNIFVSRGRHTFEVVLPGFTGERIERNIPGRLFASALVPRRVPLEVKLNCPDPAAAFAAAAADYAAWTFGGEPTVSWQIPQSLSDGAYQIGGQGLAPAAAQEILKASARFAVTHAALRDLLRAKALVDNGGLPPSPLSLARSAADIAAVLSQNPAGAAWLADALPPDSAALLIASAWYQKQLAAFAETTAAESLSPPPDKARAGAAPPARQLRVGGLLFTGISGGTLAQGEPFPHRVPVSAFMICGVEVPAPAWADFLDATPQWRADQRDALIQRQLVTGDYLADDGVADERRARETETGVTAVSWYAADAFCAWLSGKLPPAMADYEVRLPTEAEWEYAAKSARQWDAAGIRDMEGGSWEWCADPYAPRCFLAAAPEAVAAVGSPERSVRGGSWLNAAGPETRASLPPEFCSPVVSFRPVIARKGGL
jgi:formylglycine-generating enzyme required for sulfatase activity